MGDSRKWAAEHEAEISGFVSSILKDNDAVNLARHIAALEKFANEARFSRAEYEAMEVALSKLAEVLRMRYGISRTDIDRVIELVVHHSN